MSWVLVYRCSLWAMTAQSPWGPLGNDEELFELRSKNVGGAYAHRLLL